MRRPAFSRLLPKTLEGLGGDVAQVGAGDQPAAGSQDIETGGDQAGVVFFAGPGTAIGVGVARRVGNHAVKEAFLATKAV